MAFNFGQFNEFGDSVTKGDPVIEAVAKAIELGPYTGRFYQSMGAPAETLTQREFDVYKRTKTSRDGTIDADWDNDDVEGLGVSDDFAKGITVGHVLDIEGEIVVVKSVNRTNGTIAVYARGDGSTTAAAHTSGAAVKVRGFAGSDTDLKNVESISESTGTWRNYCQTIFETIDWTKLAELERKGINTANMVQTLVREAEIRVAEMLAKMAIYGVKNQATDGTKRFMSAGLLQQLGDTTNRGAYTYNVNGALTEAKLKAALKYLFDRGGNATTIWCSPTQKPWLDAFIGAMPAVTIVSGKEDHTAGGIYADRYNYQGKVLNIDVDADLPDGKLAIVNAAKCKKGWLENDGLRLVDEPAASSREKRRSLQGSVGFLIEDVGVDHILLYGITGGSAERVHNVNIYSQSGAIDTTRQIIVNADADVPAASAANYGYKVEIGTAWTSGTKITTAVKGEIWASNGSAWVKQG